MNMYMHMHVRHQEEILMASEHITVAVLSLSCFQYNVIRNEKTMVMYTYIGFPFVSCIISKSFIDAQISMMFRQQLLKFKNLKRCQIVYICTTTR